MIKKISIASVILWVIGWVIAYFIMLPPINPSNIAFWMFFIPAFFIPVFLVTQVYSLKDGFKKGAAFIPTAIIVGMVLAFFVGTFIVSPVVNAQNYTNRITITTSNFEDDIKEVDFDNLPLLDKLSAQKVGDRVVGHISELVSQFTVSNEYSLINYNGEIVRVTPLEHNGFFKYLNNLSGTAGYVIVDTTTGEAKLVRTDGLKYLPSAYFFNDLNRHLRLLYPFTNFGETSFELDENGTPYWIVQTMGYSWVSMRPRVTGVIVCNAITGDTVKYSANEVPTWVDNVYDANLVIQEIDSWGLYQNGYLNSKFAQKNVVQTTDGYTYITMEDDVYMYTGITSISSDESNIGFVMVNLRTHQAKYYEVPGAEEYSAMDSAIGVVPEKNYTSTFPLLINLNGRPTYLLSLKDSAGLVKMYGFVDASNYQKVSVSDAANGVKNAAMTYLKTIGANENELVDTSEMVITVKEVETVVIDGNTYYLVITDNGETLKIKATINLAITPFIRQFNSYKVVYSTADSNVLEVLEIEGVNSYVNNND